jgi:hypothetical protein
MNDFDWCPNIILGEDRKPLNMILDGGDLTWLLTVTQN